MTSQRDEDGARFTPYLAETVEESWARCLPVWSKRGRVDDFPRGYRAPLYLPSFETLLGRYFVARFALEYEFLLDRIVSGSETEQFCAFDLLDFLARQLYANNGSLPDRLSRCALPLPQQIERETAADSRYRDHDVGTIGKLLSFDCSDEPTV
jgi:hypothetical protein